MIHNMNLLISESATDDTSMYITENIYTAVSDVLKTPEGSNKFKRFVGEFLDGNSLKLQTSGPVYLIPFTDIDKKKFFDLFNVSPEKLKSSLKIITTKMNDKASFTYILNNPIFTLFACANKYYGTTNDEKGLNMSLAIMAMSHYPSIFTKYFKFSPNPEIMQYTIDTLSNKFIIKKVNNIFGLLMATIIQCYKFHKNGLEKGTNDEYIKYIMRIRNAYNSNMKKIAQNFMINYNSNKTIHTVSDSFEDNNVVDVENNTNRVSMICDKVTMELIINNIDISLATAAARSSSVSINDIRTYLMRILTDKHLMDMKSLIESILFIFLYDEKKSIRDINSKMFLEFGLSLYKKTNSNDKNIGNIKTILNKWIDELGITKTITRTATLINYKRAIYIFFVLAIQKYND